MGTTTKYALPWPTGLALVKDGAGAIRQLAEAVEAALLPPLLVTDGTGDPDWRPSDKSGRVPWDVTDSPARKRGTWKSPGDAERLVIPPRGGYYLVSASFRFAGKSEPDYLTIGVHTKESGADDSTATVWQQQRVNLPADTSSYSQLGVTTIARIPEGNYGVQVVVAYAGAEQPPSTAPGSNKLRVHFLSAL